MKDARNAANYLKEWVKVKWNISETIHLQVKMFTTYGTTICPSKNVGCRRQYDKFEAQEFIDDIDQWVFFDIRNFPNVQYIFKSNVDIDAIHEETTNGKIYNFEKLLN